MFLYIYTMQAKPLRRNTRVDYKTINGVTYSCLIDYTCGWNEETVFYKQGVVGIKEMYSEFSFLLRNALPIDNYPYGFIQFRKVNKGVYNY